MVVQHSKFTQQAQVSFFKHTDENLTVSGVSSLGTVERLLFNTYYGPPTLTTSSIGNKLSLYPSLSSTNLDYAIGIEDNDMFSLLNKIQLVINFMEVQHLPQLFQVVAI